jgi:hypothetical protein
MLHLYKDVGVGQCGVCCARAEQGSKMNRRKRRPATVLIVVEEAIAGCVENVLSGGFGVRPDVKISAGKRMTDWSNPNKVGR